MSSELFSELFIFRGVTVVVSRCVTKLINLTVKPNQAGETTFFYSKKAAILH